MKGLKSDESHCAGFKAKYFCNQLFSQPTVTRSSSVRFLAHHCSCEGEVLRSPDSRHGIDHKTESGHLSGGVAVTLASLLVRTDVAEPRLADTRGDRCDWLARYTKLLWGESRLPDSY